MVRDKPEGTLLLAFAENEGALDEPRFSDAGLHLSFSGACPKVSYACGSAIDYAVEYAADAKPLRLLGSARGTLISGGHRYDIKQGGASRSDISDCDVADGISGEITFLIAAMD